MENSNPNRYNEEAYYGHMNGNNNHLDPNDMATDEDAIERKKVSISWSHSPVEISFPKSDLDTELDLRQWLQGAQGHENYKQES